MNMRTLLIAAIIVVVGVIFYNQYNSEVNAPEPVGDVSSGESIEDSIEQLIGRQIADDVPKTEIVDGDSKAVITRDNNVLSVLADLPETDTDYEVKVLNSDSDEKVLGVMQSVKGGYVLETMLDDSVDLQNYNTFEITTPNESVLQGILNL